MQTARLAIGLPGSFQFLTSLFITFPRHNSTAGSFKLLFCFVSYVPGFPYCLCLSLVSLSYSLLVFSAHFQLSLSIFLWLSVFPPAFCSFLAFVFHPLSVLSLLVLFRLFSARPLSLLPIRFPLCFLVSCPPAFRSVYFQSAFCSSSVFLCPPLLCHRFLNFLVPPCVCFPLFTLSVSPVVTLCVLTFLLNKPCSGFTCTCGSIYYPPCASLLLWTCAVFKCLSVMSESASSHQPTSAHEHSEMNNNIHELNLPWSPAWPWHTQPKVKLPGLLIRGRCLLLSHTQTQTQGLSKIIPTCEAIVCHLVCVVCWVFHWPCFDIWPDVFCLRPWVLPVIPCLLIAWPRTVYLVFFIVFWFGFATLCK